MIALLLICTVGGDAKEPAPPPPKAPAPAAAAPAPPAAPAVAATVVLVDDRLVKDQAPSGFVQKIAAEIGRRRGMRVVLASEGRKRLDPKGDKAFSGCADDAGCLATAAREMGAEIVVTARLTRRDGAYFLALTRISALRPQASDDAATLAGTDADALAFIPEGVGELFPDAEIGTP